MLMNSWWVFAGVLLTFILGKQILLYLLVFNRMRGFRLKASSFSVIPIEETPPAAASVFGAADVELESLGFRFDHAAIHVPPQGEAYRMPVWIYVHEAAFVYATVFKIQLQSGALIPRCAFETFLEDGREVETSDSAIGDATENHLLKPIRDVSVEVQLQAHLEFVREKGKPCLFSSPEALHAEGSRIWHEATQLKVNRGQLIRVGEDGFAYSWKESVNRTISTLAKVRQLNNSKSLKATAEKIASSSAAPGVNEEIEQYRQTVKASEMSPVGSATKLLLLVVSMGLFCLAFRLSFSWKSVLILLGVLTFHEGGHLLGMRIFGYKNLQMLYLPFLGAVAIGGKREYVAPWKELIVLFLGPLPGFFLGVAVLAMPFFQKIPIGHELGLMLVGLNIFNLVPIHPLDGGQIWDILLFRRSPIARAIFLGLCAAALFAAGCFGVFGKAFMVFGGLLLMQFPAQMRQAKLVSALRKQFGPSLSGQTEETILASVFEFLSNQPKKLALPAKINFTRGILAQTKSDPAGFGAFLFGLAAYTSPLWVFVLGLIFLNLHRSSVGNSELTTARNSGLLVMPVEKAGTGEVDAGPILLEIGKLLDETDVDLKFSAMRRHISKPNVNPEDLRKELGDPDVAGFLVLARQAANANYIKADFKSGKRGTSMIEITQWLVLAAQCAAITGDEKNAWADLETTLRSVRMKTLGEDRFRMSAQLALTTGLQGLQKVMVRISPPADEIGRLRELLGTPNLGHQILEEKLASRIQTVAGVPFNRVSEKSPRYFLLNLLMPSWRPDPTEALAQVREIKERLKFADADSHASAEALFGRLKSDRPYGGLFGPMLEQLTLAKTALALEEYRIAHGALPEDLTGLDSLSDREREMIRWDRQASCLKAKLPMDRLATAPNAHRLQPRSDEGDDDGGEASESSDGPYTWKVRTAFK